jgi:hypothetical protein
MTVKIEKAADDIPYVNLLVYADSGAGKTVFCGSDDRVLFVAPEDDGLLSAVRLGSQADKIRVRDWPDLVAAYEYLYDNPEILEQYDWIALDSLTELQGMCLRHIVASEAAARRARDQDPDQPQIQDYGKLYILLEKMVLAFKDLPCNVIFTSLVRSAEDPDGNDFVLPMLGSNKPTDYRISMKIASHMTSYGYLRVEIAERPSPTEDEPDKKKKVKQRVIYWEDTGIYRGKDRTTRLTPKTVLPPRNALRYVRELMEGVADKSGNKAAPKRIEPKIVPAEEKPSEQKGETNLATVEA